MPGYTYTLAKANDKKYLV